MAFKLPPLGYRPLASSDESQHNEREKGYAQQDRKTARSGRKSWALLISHIWILTTTIALIVASTAYFRLLRKTTRRPLLNCGTTVAEAEQLGCAFDSLTKTWLPKDCSRRFEQEYLDLPAKYNLGPWPFWDDLTMRNNITDDDIALYAETKPLHTDVWVSSQRQHIVHCAYALMRRADAEAEGIRMDSTTENLPHMHHCLQSLLDAAMQAPHIDTLHSAGETGFGSCV
ncbi:hypothetical protein GGR57DRAFT_467788 [Xylariaceae sp. FL1272]|nr:hypothetical protein GGR57DRAFT_467788 [Xylariaceae sp. FL1272]